ncbi:Translation elongation factor Ts [hydrothermal vent metagenome]|uniref:Translation elongation factor Ts n=1 Tax=hydrothermal vent metagenome TaxID=652676 RepID=A0A3B0U882_9ZZZZ
MAISVSQVKELRELTGVGMMDCKAALIACDGDIEAAIDWLRSKGLAKAAKKAGRVAAEGLVGLSTAGKTGAVVEVNSETDFVARNEEFQQLVKSIADLALTGGDNAEKLNAMAYPESDGSVADRVTAAVAKIGENLGLRRAATLSVNEGVVASYVHNGVADGLGRMGVLVALQSSGDKDALEALGKQIAMHVAATNPLAVSAEDLDPEVVARERAVFTEQANASGKPAPIIEKMVEGRIRKFYSEVCLLEQVFVIDGENSVGDAIKLAEKTVGAPIKLSGFVRFALGEGVKKEETDFAAEVAAAAGTA